MVGKEVVTVSANAEMAKVAPVLGAFAYGGLTLSDWAYVLAAFCSLLLIVHFLMTKWIIPLARLIRGRKTKPAAAEVDQ